MVHKKVNGPSISQESFAQVHVFQSSGKRVLQTFVYNELSCLWESCSTMCIVSFQAVLIHDIQVG